MDHLGPDIDAMDREPQRPPPPRPQSLFLSLVSHEVRTHQSSRPAIGRWDVRTESDGRRTRVPHDGRT
ncbi:hypothetical protein AB4212_04595, partial [Streptomyces sp. 2MCAF27]